MERIVRECNIFPSDIKSDDVMLSTVKALVVRPGAYRIYRCPFQTDVRMMPQGMRVPPHAEAAICEAFFPSLAQIAEPDEL